MIQNESVCSRRCSRAPFTARRGFTLIELSIVIVIIGLITGAIFIGESMKRSSWIQNAITSQAKYIEAARQFKEKYGFPPGDFPNATNNWGTAGTCPGGESAGSQATCNGNGNGMIESDGGLDGPGQPSSYENFAAWQQLASAGLIEGVFTGAPGPAGAADAEPDLNVPATKYPKGGFQWYVNTPSGKYYGVSGFGYVSNFKQYLLFGASNGGVDLNAPVVSSADAAQIDTIVDDGYPSTGLVVSADAATTSLCASSSSQYNINNGKGATPECFLFFQVKW